MVDDNRDAADSLQMLLMAWGYDCRVAYDGAVGLQEAHDYRPDCLLLDIAMPGLDGYTLARKVREQDGLENVKLVALTAYSDERHLRRSREAGFDFHLTKPADPSELRRLIEMLEEVIRLTSKTEEISRQNLSLAGETNQLLKDVKVDMKEIKEELKEISTLKEDLEEVKEHVKELKEDLSDVKEGLNAKES